MIRYIWILILNSIAYNYIILIYKVSFLFTFYYKCICRQILKGVPRNMIGEIQLESPY